MSLFDDLIVTSDGSFVVGNGGDARSCEASEEIVDFLQLPRGELFPIYKAKIVAYSVLTEEEING